MRKIITHKINNSTGEIKTTVTKIIIHTMKDCHQCEECRALLKRFNIKAEWVLDDPALDIEYPYIALKTGIRIKLYRYDEILSLIDEGVI